LHKILFYVINTFRLYCKVPCGLSLCFRVVILKMNLQERASLYFLHSIPGIGNKTLWKIKQVFGSFSAGLQADSNRLYAFLKAAVAAEILERRRQQDPVSAYQSFLENGLGLVCWEDDEYPVSLRTIHNAPYILYYQGRLTLVQDKSIAIVGARKASSYGRIVAHKLASELAGAGVVIVSGMARGIDTEAHRGALETGATIAVLGSALDCPYPPENKKLYQLIAEKSLALSEFPPGTRPEPGNFPMRNRIICGLSRGVIVVEAGQRSGALITADLALEQGRDVFAVPGPINSSASIGTNHLIQQGAKLVCSVNDIVEEYPDWLIRDKMKPPAVEISGEEQDLLQHLAGEACHIDVLMEKTGTDIGQLSTLLLRLEFQGIIRSLPGNYYVRV
jgi:DNA processing protein